MSDLLFLGLAIFAWWAQRDAYAKGRQQGRLDERRDSLEREFRKQGKHLRLVKP